MDTFPYPKNLVDFLEHGAVRTHPDLIGFEDQDRAYTLEHIWRAARRIGAAIATHMDDINRHLVAPVI